MPIIAAPLICIQQRLIEPSMLANTTLFDFAARSSWRVICNVITIMSRIVATLLCATAGVLTACDGWQTDPRAEAHMSRDRVPGPAGALYVDDGGEGGMPVVFLHSYAGSTTHWAAQLAHLRPQRRALAIDLRESVR